MASKKPLCLYGGEIKELQAGDTLAGAGGGAVSIEEVTLDFGVWPVLTKTFVFALAGASIGERVLMSAQGTGDELEYDGFSCAARVSAEDEITAHVHAVPGPVTGARVFNIVRG